MGRRKKKTMKKYKITLPETQVNAIDAYAMMLDLDRSELVSSMLEKALSTKEIMDGFLPKDNLVVVAGRLFGTTSERSMKIFLRKIGMSEDEFYKSFGELLTDHKEIQETFE